MKKSLIALAALATLATAGTAMAQSSVTIYGIIDNSVGGQKLLGKGTESKMFHGGNGGLKTSRLGFRGTEDLGGGLKAQFKLEQRMDTDTGAQQAPMFKAESTLGLSGGFGTLRVGRMVTQYDDIRALSYSSNIFDSAFTPASNGVFGSGGDYSSRFNSQIRYEMPAIGGLYGGLSYAFEQTANRKDIMAGFMLGYKGGPLNVALGYQDEKTKSKYTALSGSYDFGVLSLSGGYNHRNGTAATGKDNEYTFGVNVPMGAINLSAGYANSKTKVNGVTTSKSDGFGLGATYTLSKRTRLYAGYRAHTVKNTAGVKTADTTIYAVGVRHDF